MTELTDAILAGFTIVLAGATIAYAYWTWKLFKVNEKLLAVQESTLSIQGEALKAEKGSMDLQERALAFNQEKFKVERRPVIFAMIVEANDLVKEEIHYYVHLKNVSRVPANNVQAMLFVVHSARCQLGELNMIPVILPGDGVRLPYDLAIQMTTHNQAIEVEVSLQDLNGERIVQTKQAISIFSILKTTAVYEKGGL